MGALLDAHPDAVLPAIEAAALAGTEARRAVGHQLHLAVSRATLTDDAIISLIVLADRDGLRRLRADLRRIVVDRARAAGATRPDGEEPRIHLAHSLHSLGVSLWEVGEHREALATVREAVGLRRELAKAEPPRYIPGLPTR